MQIDKQALQREKRRLKNLFVDEQMLSVEEYPEVNEGCV